MNTSSPNGSLVSFETWVAALASSACIGFTSLVPWLFNLTFFEKCEATAQKGQQDGGDSQMKYLLGFAIGAILGDIFFHLIPESIESHMKELGDSFIEAERNVGVSIIAGIFLFIIVEMALQKWSGQEETQECNHTSNSNVPMSNKDDQDLRENPPNRASMIAAHLSKQLANENNNNDVTIDSNGNSFQHRDNELATDISDQINNNYIASSHDQNLIHRRPKILDTTSHDDVGSKGVIQVTAHDLLNVTKSLTIDPAGYLNLIANGFDNFTHGLAIGASFLVGMKVGILTTFVIFIHEIPHEICDYAILVKSGFSRWEAVKAQSSVSLFGTMGTALALYVKSVDKLHAKTVWILPFSAGGFLYIALVTLLPDILDKESNLRNSLGQIASVMLGIAFMGLVALL